MLYHFAVPGTPVAWQRVTDAKGRKINPKAMVMDQKAIAAAAGVQWLGRAPHFGPVKLFVSAIFAIPPSWSVTERAAAKGGLRYRDIDPDADRLLNQVMDGLKFVAFVDDNQVVDCRCVMRYGEPERREVWVEELAGGNKDAMTRRTRKWKSGGYNSDIVKAPCGQARWPLVINADAHKLGLELVR